MRPELLSLLHETLKSLNVRDDDAHMLIDWISDDMDADRRMWMLRAGGMFAIGLALGTVIVWLAR